MGLTNTMVKADMDAIFSDLGSLDATETVDRIAAGATASDISFSIVRAKKRTAEELKESGYEKQYTFSFFAQRDDIGETTEGDVIVMSSGDRVRVFNMEEQPARVMVLFDLGSEFEDGEGI